jgi:tetratricopeptide (TPR) repeat protein
MNKLIYPFLSILFAFQAIGQDDSDRKDAYPSTYTFEKAEEFIARKEYAKAMWFYINLYPQYRAKVEVEIKRFRAQHDSIDMIPFMKKSFAIYAPSDPTINAPDNLNPELGKEKNIWLDAIILRFGDNDKALPTSFAYYGRGVRKLRVNEYEWAILDFNKAIELEPSSGETYFQRAEARRNLDEFIEAAADYAKAIQYEYKLALSYCKMGEVYFKAGNYSEAIKNYTLAIKEDPNMAEAYAGRGRVKQQQKKFKEALSDMDIAVKIQPTSAEILMIRAWARREAGEKKDSCSDWKAALALGAKRANEFLKKYCN